MYVNLSGAGLGAGASLNGDIPFLDNNAWNTDISGAAVDANSDTLIAGTGLTRSLHPDYGDERDLGPYPYQPTPRLPAGHALGNFAT